MLRNYNFHMEHSSHPWYRKLITVHISMFLGWLGKLNTFVLNAFFFFAMYVMAFEVLQPKIYEWELPVWFESLPGFFPFLYVFLCIYLVLASLNFKVDKITSATKKD